MHTQSSSGNPSVTLVLTRAPQLRLPPAPVTLLSIIQKIERIELSEKQAAVYSDWKENFLRLVPSANPISLLILRVIRPEMMINVDEALNEVEDILIKFLGGLVTNPEQHLELIQSYLDEKEMVTMQIKKITEFFQNKMDEIFIQANASNECLRCMFENLKQKLLSINQNRIQNAKFLNEKINAVITKFIDCTSQLKQSGQSLVLSAENLRSQEIVFQSMITECERMLNEFI